MQIQVTYDQSQGSLPSGFVTAINYVVNYYDTLFTNNVTINIHVGYGEIDRQTLSSGALGESYAPQYVLENYNSVKSALQAQGAPGASTLPASSPLSGNLYMPQAEAQAMALTSAISTSYVGFSNNAPWSYTPNATPAANQYYFVGVVEHEFTEVMGRVSLIDGQPSYYSPMDLYRFSAPGVHSLTTGGTGSTTYFSVNNGTTNLGTWNNNPSNGDLGDWYPQGPASGGHDAFNDYSSPGVINAFSANDITLMAALGWSTFSTTVIESAGSTSLVEVGNSFFFYPVGGSSGPALQYGGGDVVAGQWSGWTPIGVEQTASGYEVAWKLAGADQYTVWNTDSNGNFISHAIGTVSGTSSALESLETSFHQDLNGDGVIGVPGTVIESAGSTSLVEVGNSFFFYPVGGSSGPALQYGSGDVVAGLWGGWTPIGVEQTASGYEVAWKLAGADQYTVWNTDSNGNFISHAIGTVSGTSSALESLETSFHQDLNGDGVIGVPGTVIEAAGSTSLVEVGNSFFFYPVGGASGPALQYGGADVVAGLWGGWTPIGVEQTASGYEVAWKLAGADQYTVWNTDSNGNFISHAISTVSGTSSALESLETSFHQDLNGDGVIGVPLSAMIGHILNSATNEYSSDSHQIGLSEINYNSIQGDYVNGVRTETDGADIANLEPDGFHNLESFKFASDGSGGTIVNDPLSIKLSVIMPTSSGQNATASESQLGETPVHNTIVASGPNAILTGHGSNDTFVFAPGFGQAVITNYSLGRDTIQIDHTDVATAAAALAAAHDDGHGNVVIADATHDSITLLHIAVAQLHQSDFLIN